jgi:hypothetical protein
MEKRRYQRMRIKDFTVDVSDGIGFFQGSVADVSRFGLRMIDLPKRINGDAKRMTVVISGKSANYKMKVRPRWQTQDGFTKLVGAEIMDTPWGWTEFVMELEPPREKDVWDSIYI